MFGHRHAGPVMSDCQPRRNPGVACSASISVILCFGLSRVNSLKERLNLTRQNPAQRQLRQSVRGKEGGLR